MKQNLRRKEKGVRSSERVLRFARSEQATVNLYIALEDKLLKEQTLFDVQVSCHLHIEDRTCWSWSDGSE